MYQHNYGLDCNHRLREQGGRNHWTAPNSSHPKSRKQSCAPCRQGYSTRVQEFWNDTFQDEPCTLDKTVSSTGVSSPLIHWEVKVICLVGITQEVQPTKGNSRQR